jgi:hypothetical protein
VGTVCLARIIAEMHSQEYNVYFRTISWWLAAPIQLVLESRLFFAVEFSGLGTFFLPHMIDELYSRECNVHFRTIRQGLAAPNHKVLKGQPVFCS